MQPRLTRSRTEKMLSGVCGGLGIYFDIDPVIVRLVFVLLTISSGAGVPLYILLTILMPRESKQAAVPMPTFSQQDEQHHPHAAYLEQQSEQVAGWPEQPAAQPARQVRVAQPQHQYQQRVAQVPPYQQGPQSGDQSVHPGVNFQVDVPVQSDAVTGPTIKLPHQQSPEQPFDVPPIEKPERQRNWGTLGIILMGIGMLILLEQMTGTSLAFVLPVLLIAAGVLLLVRWRL